MKNSALSPRLPVWASLVLLALISNACTQCNFSVGKSNQDRAREDIEADGHREVVLTPVEGTPNFTVTAKKGVMSCTGNVTTEGTSINWETQCNDLLPFAELETTCTAGDQEACTLVAKALVNGDGVPADIPRSASLFVPACEAGESMACFYVGLAHASGERGLPADPGLAYSHYDRACSGGTPEGCHNLAGMILDNNAPSPADAARVKGMLEANCTEEQKLSCGLLGKALADGRHMAADAARARGLLQAACEGGDARYCSDLGLLLLRGQGGPPNPQVGIAMLDRGCQADQPVACAELGRVLVEGAGVPQDRARAMPALAKACQLGHQGACQLSQR